MLTEWQYVALSAAVHTIIVVVGIVLMSRYEGPSQFK